MSFVWWQAEAFEAAVKRWLIAVSFWELRLCGHCVRAWAARVRWVKDAAVIIAGRHSIRTVRLSWIELVAACKEQVGCGRANVRRAVEARQTDSHAGSMVDAGAQARNHDQLDSFVDASAAGQGELLDE